MPHQQRQFVALQARVVTNGVGYGVLLNSVALPKGERISIDDVTNRLVQDMQ